MRQRAARAIIKPVVRIKYKRVPTMTVSVVTIKHRTVSAITTSIVTTKHRTVRAMTRSIVTIKIYDACCDNESQISERYKKNSNATIKHRTLRVDCVR